MITIDVDCTYAIDVDCKYADCKYETDISETDSSWIRDSERVDFYIFKTAIGGIHYIGNLVVNLK